MADGKADEQCMRWWKTTFSGKIDKEKRVDIKLFMQGLQAKFGQVNVGPDERFWPLAVKQLISNNTLAISEGKIQAFVARFGPWDTSLPTALDNLYEKPGLPHSWFHSFVSREQVKDLLANQPVGAYLIRFSSSHPDDIVLSYIRVKSGVISPKHIVIARCEKGFMFKGEKTAPFESIPALISKWGSKAVDGKKRLNSPIKTEIYFKLSTPEDDDNMYAEWAEGEDGELGGVVDSGGAALADNFE